MAGDAVVTVGLQHDAKAHSPLATLQAEAGSQHPAHPTANGIPHPPGPALNDIPASTAAPPSLHSTPKTHPLSLAPHLPVASPGGAAAPLPAPPPPDHAECAFCGLMGTPRTCGSLVAVTLGGQEAAVHHGCALWAPQVYQPQGYDEYLNLELEWRLAQGRGCRRCGVSGAAATCTHAGCRVAYHLPCAVAAGNVGLDTASYELWCPRHAAGSADSDGEGAGGRQQGYGAREGGFSRRGGGSAAEDDEFVPSGTGSRPRRHAALSRRHRFQRGPGGPGGAISARDRAATAAAATAAALAVADRTQRPRTDWQRQGDTWVKVVPPWWCEHRTIHFANKVFRELFCGASSALLVDADGTEWDCAVACETRNDLRLQYTLRGAFHDFWDAAGVRAGDVLTFERNALTAGPGRILVGRYPQGRGLEEALEASGGASEGPALPPLPPAPPRAPRSAALPRRDSSLSEVATAGAGAGAFFPPPQRPVTTAPTLPAFGVASVAAGSGGGGGTSHPNRWADLPDGSAAKTVYKSTLSHQQCPVAGWLYRKLYGRLPADADSAPMTDPVLGADFVFEVTYIPAANVHYLGGRAFGAWLRQAGVRSGDQIRVWRDQAGVKLCRMGPSGAAPPPMATSVPISGPALPAAATESTPRVAGVAAAVGPPSTGALAALNALAAAAGYAGQHGTPAIQAVLAAAAELRDAGGSSDGEALVLRLTAAGVPLPPSPFLPNKRKAEGEEGAAPKRGSPGAGDATARAPPLPPPAAAGQATLPPPQLHHALQHLLRQFQAQQQQQQQQRQGAAGSLPQLPLPQPLSTQPRPPLPPLNLGSSLPMHNPAHQQPQQPQPQQQTGGVTFGVVTAALARHAWAPAEAAALVQFRAKCALTDAVTREAAFASILQLQSNKNALLNFTKGFLATESAAPPGTAPAPPSAAGGP